MKEGVKEGDGESLGFYGLRKASSCSPSKIIRSRNPRKQRMIINSVRPSSKNSNLSFWFWFDVSRNS